MCSDVPPVCQLIDSILYKALQILGAGLHKYGWELFKCHTHLSIINIILKVIFLPNAPLGIR